MTFTYNAPILLALKIQSAGLAVTAASSLFICRGQLPAVELIHMLEHRIGFGMVKDTTTLGDDADDWPGIQRRIMAADILVVGTPIWLGVKSSVATLAIERLYAYTPIRL